MSVPGELVSAALFRSRREAEEAWDHLADAGIPATVVTDPGLLGKYTVSVEVEREDLDRAVAALQAKLSDDDQGQSGE
ncbi:MAG: hypothetical protein BMS9Abin17_1224 [Acidimicrobiia bacterium]|nr:MAG: hypothetical protein BMS9Abin17_1224 [Acidimicrobiia bacterium]